MIEFSTVILVIILTCAPFAVAGLWWWFCMFVSLFVVVGLFELASFKIKGHSMSRQFWTFASNNRGRSLVVALVITTGWVLLMAHLLFQV